MNNYTVDVSFSFILHNMMEICMLQKKKETNLDKLAHWEDWQTRIRLQGTGLEKNTQKAANTQYRITSTFPIGNKVSYGLRICGSYNAELIPLALALFVCSIIFSRIWSFVIFFSGQNTENAKIYGNQRTS